MSWIPGGGHIGKLAPNMDRNLRSLSDRFGGMNFNSVSPSRENRAAPRANHPQPGGPLHLGQKSFGPGFTSNVYNDKAACEVSQQPVNMRAATVAIGDLAAPFSRAATVPTPSGSRGIFDSGAVLHGRHVPSGGGR